MNVTSHCQNEAAKEAPESYLYPWPKASLLAVCLHVLSFLVKISTIGSSSFQIRKNQNPNADRAVFSCVQLLEKFELKPSDSLCSCVCVRDITKKKISNSYLEFPF